MGFSLMMLLPILVGACPSMAPTDDGSGQNAQGTTPTDDAGPPTGTGSDGDPVILNAASSTGQWLTGVSTPTMLIRPYENIVLTASLRTDPGVPVVYEWGMQIMTAAPQTAFLGEFWSADGTRRYGLFPKDTMGSSVMFRAGAGLRPEPDSITVKVYKLVNGTRELLGSNYFYVKVATNSGGGVGGSMEISSDVSGMAKDWKLSLYATVKWASTGSTVGYRVELHTPSQQEFLDWFYLGNPPSYPPRYTMMYDRWEGPWDGVLIRECTGFSTGIGVGYREHHWNGEDPPPRSWIDPLVADFASEQWSQWGVMVMPIPDWTVATIYTGNP